MERINRFFHKHGIFGIFKVLHWKYVKTIGKVHAKTIYKKDFLLRLEKINTVYALQPDDCDRLLRGEKKILFYDPDCELSKKDIKFRWESLRNQDCFALAHYIDIPDAEKALLSMLDKALADELANTVAMEVSIRAINIIETARLIESERKFPDALKIQIETYIKRCLIFIFNNLEKGIGYSGNHYFFNLLGICWILNNVRDSNYVIRLKKHYLHIFEKELVAMLNDDGSLYECSTYYHRYVTEAFLEFLYYNPNRRTHNLENLAKRMVEFCIYSSDDGRLFGFGDNDSGRVLPLPCYYSYSSRDLSVIIMLAGKLGIKLQRRSMKDYQAGSRFGIFKIENEEWTVAIRCDEIQDSRKNKTIGVHAHNDQLEILASYKGKEIFVGSGTYLYVSDNDSRVNNMKTDRHSTIVVREIEQNTIYNSWKYTERTAKANLLKHKKENIKAELIFNREINIVREVKVGIDGFKICDTVQNKMEYTYYSSYILSPSVSVKQIDKKTVILIVEDFEFVMIVDTLIEIKECDIAEEYGHKKLTKRICVECINGMNTVRVDIKKRGDLHE